MTITIIFVVLIIIGYRLSGTSEHEGFGYAILFFSCIFGSLHSVFYFTQHEGYERYMVRRTALIKTLEHSRTINSYENAAVTMLIIKRNEELAFSKWQNNHFIIGYYVDDRYEQLEMIK